MRNHLPDHPQIHVCSVDGIFSQNKHTSSRKAPKAILRDEVTRERNSRQTNSYL